MTTDVELAIVNSDVTVIEVTTDNVVIDLISENVDLTANTVIEIDAETDITVIQLIDDTNTVTPEQAADQVTIEIRDNVEQGPPGIQGPPGDTVRTVDAVANGTVGGHRAVLAVGDGSVMYVDTTNQAHAGKVIGITLNAALDGDPVSVAVVGPIVEPSFTFAPGPIYFNAIGVLTQVRPSSGFIQQVAIALSATTIVVQIGMPVILA
jgi:hypothetical protein